LHSSNVIVECSVDRHARRDTPILARLASPHMS